MTFKPGRVVRSRGPDTALPTGQNDKGSLKSYLYKYTKYSRNRTNSTVEMVLPDPCERPHRQCFMSAPIHTHTWTHTSVSLYARNLHSTCTYAAVLHAASTQISQHAFLYLNGNDALTQQTQTQSHSQPPHNTRKPDRKRNPNHTRTHFCKCE